MRSQSPSRAVVLSLSATLAGWLSWSAIVLTLCSSVISNVPRVMQAVITTRLWTEDEFYPALKKLVYLSSWTTVANLPPYFVISSPKYIRCLFRARMRNISRLVLTIFIPNLSTPISKVKGVRK